MQILVLYFSKTGHTRALAKAFAEGAGEVEGADVLLRTADEITIEEFEACDAVIAGSPVYFGSMAAQLKEVFDRFLSVRRKMEGKPGAAFATAGDASGGKETTMMSIIQALLIYGMVIVGDPLAATGHYGTSCKGEPGEADLEHAQLHGRHVSEITAKLRG